MNSIFKVYEGNHILIDGKPLVIITGMPGMDSGIRSEAFIFVQNDAKDFYCQTYFGKQYEDANPPSVKIDMDFILRESCLTAECELNEHLKRKAAESKIPSYLNQPYIIKEVEPVKLFGLIMRNKYEDKIDIMYESTKSRNLKLYINKLRESPQIRIIE